MAAGRVIAGRRVQPGDLAEIHLKVSETVTHQPARIPVTVVAGTEPGPTLFLTAAVHGDEINGTAIVREVLNHVEPDNIQGTLIGVPVVNRFGFTTGDRYLPDRRDLNRFFPGDDDGSMAGRIGNTLYRKILAKCDAGIDLHTAAGGRANLCHVRGDASHEEVRHMMRAFGVPILMDDKGPKGALRRATTDKGIPTIIFEAGEPNRFQRHVVEIGSLGVFRVMRHLGMWKRRLPAKPAFQTLVRRSEWLRADHGGILDLQVEPGDLVRTNQRIGIIYDPFGRHVDEITATHSGVVLGTSTSPLTNPGQAIIHVGHLHKTLQKARAYVKAGGDLGHVNWPDSPPAPPTKRKSKSRTKAPGKSRATTRKKPGARSATKEGDEARANTEEDTGPKAKKTTRSGGSSAKTTKRKAPAKKESSAASKKAATPTGRKATGTSNQSPAQKSAQKSAKKSVKKTPKRTSKPTAQQSDAKMAEKLPKQSGTKTARKSAKRTNKPAAKQSNTNQPSRTTQDRHQQGEGTHE